MRQGTSWWWVPGPQDIPCPGPSRAWCAGSATGRAARALTKAAGRTRRVPPLGRAWTMLPPPPPPPHPLRPGAAASLALPPRPPTPAPRPMGAPGLSPLPGPPRPPRAHRSRIQRAGAQRRAPAAGPTRRVCLKCANGAIVPPPDPEARPISRPRRGFEGAWGTGWRGDGDGSPALGRRRLL